MTPRAVLDRVTAQGTALALFATAACIYFLANFCSSVSFHAASATLFFYILWIMTPGFVVSYLLVKDAILAFFLATPFGLLVHALFFSVSVGTKCSWIYSMIYPALFVASGIQKNILPLPLNAGETCKKAAFSVAVLVVSAALLLTYRSSVMDQGNVLPAQPGSSAFIWLDLSYFMGNSASLMTHILPPDYRILGEPLRYHIIYQQMLGACSSVFQIELFELYSRIFPILLTLHLLVALIFYSFMRDWTSAQIAYVIAFSLLTAVAGTQSSFSSGWDLTLNLYTSPTILFGFINFLAIPAILSRRKNECFTSAATSVVLLFLFFVLCGIKLSVGFIAYVGFCATWILMRIRSNKSVTLMQPVAAGAGLALAYTFYFLDSHGGMASAAQISVSSPFLSLMPLSVPPILRNFLQRYLAFLGVSLVRASVIIAGFAIRHLLFWLGIITIVLNRYRDLDAPEIFLAMSGIAGLCCAAILSETSQPVHFYHQGIFCLAIISGVGVGQWRSRLSKLGLGMITIYCMIPLLGDHKITFFQGRDDSGAAILRADELDFDSLSVFRKLRSLSAPTDIVLTGKTRLYNYGGKPYYFLASALSERQTYLEGWGFSKYGEIRYASPLTIEAKELRQNSFYLDVEGTFALRFLKESNVKWIVWDERTYGKPKTWVNTILSREFSAGPIDLFRLKQ